ncbi:glycosyl hydrolase [Pterulicium gracile]|uniref:Glycosyl hydrolase n=1 Tax=Pterulicium gracile TaxID=1884261 RepID=A0A5C3QGZ3_9AGAR|nr:glycosyl hydrolase [Pterula gracilis]
MGSLTTRLLTLLTSLLLLTPSLVLGLTNPVLWHDLADLDIFRVNTTYYYSASTMHHSPGAPILRSNDLANWEYIGHSLPRLQFDNRPEFDLTNGQRAYVKGVWASWMRFVPQKNTWFWGGCISGVGRTVIMKAPAATGPWTKHTELSKCYYDSGLFVDDNGTMYISYSNGGPTWVAQMNADLTAEVRSQLVFTAPTPPGYLEGTRMYKRNGTYYILLTKPPDGTWMIKSSSPWGPYTLKVLVQGVPNPVPGANAPHQGALIDLPDGRWAYAGFLDAYPGGRIPVIAPVTWGSDGFPAVTLVNGALGATYPDFLPSSPVPSLNARDTFPGPSLGPQWEWNHNPDTSRFALSSSSGLRLTTASQTFDIYQARNTLTRRIPGPISTATIQLNYGEMRDGDRAGLALWRDRSAWIGVIRNNGTISVAYTDTVDLTLSSWTTANSGVIRTTAPISGGTIYLRISADVQPSGNKQATFKWSTNQSQWNQIGTYTMSTVWNFFLGYRFAIFNYGTVGTGGAVTVPWFQIDMGRL